MEMGNLLSFFKPGHIFISMIVYLDPGNFASESWFYRKKKSHRWQNCIYRKILVFFFSDSKQSNIEKLYLC